MNVYCIEFIYISEGATVPWNIHVHKNNFYIKEEGRKRRRRSRKKISFQTTAIKYINCKKITRKKTETQKATEKSQRKVNESRRKSH